MRKDLLTALNTTLCLMPTIEGGTSVAIRNTHRTGLLNDDTLVVELFETARALGLPIDVSNIKTEVKNVPDSAFHSIGNAAPYVEKVRAAAFVVLFPLYKELHGIE